MLEALILPPEIVITASRAREEEDETAASVTVVTEERIERLGEPLVPALLRLTPSTTVATSGPAGSLTEVRIRGAEANHTLLFIDGIRVNDPAAGNQPRFELLNADIVSRIEVVRGPQSALWGSEAVGGVIAINGIDQPGDGISAAGEAGSLDFRRASGSFSLANGAVGLAAAAGYQRSNGIDAFDGTGDRDGYRNLSGRVRATWSPSSGLEFGASGLALTGRSRFDGYDPLTFRRADTADSSRNRLVAGRIWSRIGSDDSWSGRIAASLLGSSNRNLLGGNEINRTRGGRWTVGAQLERRFNTGTLRHRLILAADHEDETIHARDSLYGGLSNQDRKRDHQALTLEWKGAAGPLIGDVAVRRDAFGSFEDATTLRASLLADLGSGFSLAGSYGEGIAQPTFFDLYGFFPGNFVGNPALKPERSRGIEASLRFRRDRFEASITGYRQRLNDEIVDIFDPATFLSSTANRSTDSRRSGIEAEAGWSLGAALRLTAHYAYLDASEPSPIGERQQHELRRPRHSGAVAADGALGRLSYGVSLAYTGGRSDTDFDTFPARVVRLAPYWLAGARLAYAVRPGVELFARASNALDEDYQDVFANRTEKRTVYAGIRLARSR